MPTKSKSKKSTTSSKAKKQVALPKKQPIVNPNKQIMMRNTHAVCGLSDPFCSHANGAKFPDNSSVRTLPMSLRGTFDLVSSPAGVACFLFQPTFKYSPQCLPVVLGPGGAVTAWADRAPMNTTLPATGYRIVSSGFKMRRVCAPLYSSGIVRVRSWPTANFASLDAMPTAAYTASACSDIALQDVKEFAAITQHNASPPQLFYTDDELNVKDQTPNGYQPITVFVSGAPVSQTILVVEWVINYELVFDEESPLAQIATNPPPANSILTNAAARVTSSIPAFFEKGVDAVAGFIQRKALSALGSFLGGPAGAATGTAMAMLVD